MINLKRNLILALSLLSLASFPHSAAAEDVLKLEITLEDTQDPSQSLAIINGESVKLKDTLGGYEIIQISSSSVKVRNLSTNEESVIVPQGLAPPAPVPLVSSEEKKAEEPKQEKNILSDLLQAPGKLTNRFWEMRGLKDLVIINNAAVSYFNQKAKFPLSLSELVQANLLSSVYESGMKEKYRFYMLVPPDPKDFGIHADPQDPAQGLLFFYVGTDTVVRQSKSGPAGPKSPPHAY